MKSKLLFLASLMLLLGTSLNSFADGYILTPEKAQVNKNGDRVCVVAIEMGEGYCEDAAFVSYELLEGDPLNLKWVDFYYQETWSYSEDDEGEEPGEYNKYELNFSLTPNMNSRTLRSVYLFRTTYKDIILEICQDGR